MRAGNRQRRQRACCSDDDGIVANIERDEHRKKCEERKRRIKNLNILLLLGFLILSQIRQLLGRLQVLHLHTDDVEADHERCLLPWDVRKPKLWSKFEPKTRVVKYLVPLLPTPQQSSDTSKGKPRVVRITHFVAEKDTASRRLVEELGQRGAKMRHYIEFGSEDYEDRQLSPPTPEKDCIPQHKWQTKSFPTCNALHELNLEAQAIHEANKNMTSKFLLGTGNYRSVFRVESLYGDSRAEGKPQQGSDNNELVTALKMLRYDVGVTERRIERHRIDALIAERLTKSKHILDIYAYCGNSALYDFASGGSLKDILGTDIHKKWSVSKKLRIAHDAASAFADLHGIDGKHHPPSAIHADIDPGQFVKIGKTYKLNDFNGGLLLYKNPHDNNRVCKVDEYLIGGNHRSPECYRNEPIDEKSDIYGLGNVIFAIVAGHVPFDSLRYSTAEKLVVKGERAALPEDVVHSKDPRMKAMVHAIESCWMQDPSKRPSARQIANALKVAMKVQI